MADTEKIISDEMYRRLVECAVAHAQFGAIRADGGDAFIVPSGIFDIPTDGRDIFGMKVAILPILRPHEGVAPHLRPDHPQQKAGGDSYALAYRDEK